MEVKLQFWQQRAMSIFNINFMVQLATFFNEKNISIYF